MVHINGSICINVFLGLGVPWLFCAIYRESRGEVFVVDTRELYWCVVIYVGLSIVSTATLLLRRNLTICGRAEFGGPKTMKICCGVFMFLLWILYVALTWLKTASVISGI